MTRAISVDREAEIAIFENMLRDKTEEKILIIVAKSSFGKSTLLREYVRRRPTNFHFADIDFKVGSTTLPELFSRLCDKLGEEKRFPKFYAELHNVARQSNIASNFMVGQNQIENYLVGQNEQDRQLKISALTETFFADLRTLGKTLIILDTFERADDSLKKWMADSFLPRIYHSKNLYVVISGQGMPEQTLEWECEHIELHGISHEHWHKYAESIGVKEPMDFFRGYCLACQGNPYQIKTLIDQMATQRQMA
jgi:hypothetical protein